MVYDDLLQRDNLEPKDAKLIQYLAKQRGMDFNIDFEDVIIPEVCPILGIPIVSGIQTGSGGNMNSASLDRIDNNKGYIKGNVQVISHKANSMKFTATPEELLLFADWIYKTYKGNK